MEFGAVRFNALVSAVVEAFAGRWSFCKADSEKQV